MTPTPIPSPRASKISTLTAQRLLAVALVIGVSGCSDKAKPKYDECVALETKWETAKARDACKAAAAIDPKSQSGKLAAGKLTYLNEQADKILAEKAKKEAPCKVGKWVTHCLYQGKPRPTLLEANTFARCNTEADEVRVVGMTCPVCECADRFVDPYKKEGE
jgi:hypothetical protein